MTTGRRGAGVDCTRMASPPTEYDTTAGTGPNVVSALLVTVKENAADDDGATDAIVPRVVPFDTV